MAKKIEGEKKAKKALSPAHVLINAAERLKRQSEIEKEFESITKQLGEDGKKVQALFDEWKALRKD